jgi:hypothetical protein
LRPSAAISSGEKGAEEMVDIEPLEKWDKPNFTDFLPKPGNRDRLNLRIHTGIALP